MHLLTALLTALAVTTTALAQTTTENTRPLRIVTSFLPIQSHTLAIAGQNAEVVQLLGKDAGPHDFQLSPSDVKKLAEADLFIINGAGIEDWLDDLVKKSGNKDLVIVDTSKGVDLVESPEEVAIAGGHGHHHHHGHNHHHHHGDGGNPHIWLDPVIAQKQAANIVAALQKADPANAAAYAENGEAYAAELEALDAEYRATLAPLPTKNLVSFHDAFPYLSARYGLNYLGAIAEFPEKDPTPRQLASLADKIRELKVGVIFAETGYARGLLAKIAKETGAKVSSLDTLEVGQGGAKAYLERMRKNLSSLQRAFARDE
ncbi:MAG: ABC transporter substrate-binding protein [Verrucomicrobia bacterium]|nr:ABC transporter substrate-binding protein [Verrucomicrobiota bacterium]